MLYVGRLTIIYSILLSIELYGEIKENKSIIWICKPLLMPFLLILFLLNSKNNLFIERICLSLSLIFSCIGDILFIEKRKDLFLYGVFVYLIVHIFYIIIFLIEIKSDKKYLKEQIKFVSMIKISIPFIIYLIYFLNILYPKLNNNREETKDLFIPIVIYGFIIISMGYISYLREKKLPGFWSVFLGALFFILSDSLLAYNRFVSQISLAGLSVMFTYGLGQYLITIGILQLQNKYHKNI